MPNAFHFDGRVAKAPVLTRPGNSAVCKFTLIRNEYAGKDEATGTPREERAVSIQITAFGKKAEAIAQNAMQGDQLFVTTRIENNNFAKDGVEVYGFNFILEDFDFGAPGPQKRAQLAAQHGGK
jgi:single-strand DNA-binding protein